MIKLQKLIADELAQGKTLRGLAKDIGTDHTNQNLQRHG